MDTDDSDRPVVAGPFDPIAEDLQLLRTAAGMPSYNDIVVRIAAHREARGVTPGSTRPARTTVYDAFRPGRRRLDAALVGDIVRALGADEAEVRAWEARVLAARLGAETGIETTVATTTVAEPAPVPDSRPTARPMTRRWITAVLIGCLALNLCGRVTVDFLGLSIYLDMVGTAVAAVVVGPWWGALVGLVTNVGGVAFSGPTSLPFAVVNVGGALVWGYGVRRFGLGRTLSRYFGLNLLVSVTCTALAAPILVLLGGAGHHGSDEVIDTLLAATHHFVVAVFTGNLLTSVADKMISGFVALVAAEALGRPILEHRP